MVAFVMLHDRGMVGLDGPFSGHTHFGRFLVKQDRTSLGHKILSEELMEATIGTVHALSARAVKRYVPKSIVTSA
jgi:hypothetical protein